MRRRRTILLVVALAAAICACGGDDSVSSFVPGFLIGTWRAESETYRGAFVRLAATTVEIGTVERTIERYSVSRVRRAPGILGTLYTIEYKDQGGDDSHIEFYADHQTLRLKNLDAMEWKWSRY